MREFHLLTIAEAHAHVGPLVDAVLGPRGFANVRPLQWVDSSAAPIRRLFEYAPLKGGVVCPWWGYSFDFVPHVSAGKLKWHRTEKSATFDVLIDGQDVFEDLVATMWGTQGLLDGLPVKVRSGVGRAVDFWQAAPTPGQVMDQVIALAQAAPRHDLRLQLPMAAAMCHALAGREEAGRQYLERYLARARPREEDLPRFRQVFEGALHSASPKAPA